MNQNTEILTPIAKCWTVKLSNVLFLNTWKSLDTICTKYFPHANVSWHNRLGIQLMSISSRSNPYDLQHPLWPEMNPSWFLFTAFHSFPEQSRVLQWRKKNACTNISDANSIKTMSDRAWNWVPSKDGGPSVPMSNLETKAEAKIVYF